MGKKILEQPKTIGGVVRWFPKLIGFSLLGSMPTSEQKQLANSFGFWVAN